MVASVPTHTMSMVDMAAITTATAGATRDTLVMPDRVPGIVAPPQRRLTVRSLLSPGQTSQNAVQYVEETGFTNAAAVVSEGDLKPESTLSFELRTQPVATIAHFVVASKQILDDAPMLESPIDGRLRYGVAYVEEVQRLNGDGTGTNLFGLIPRATPFEAPFITSLATRIDVIAQAITQVETAQYPVTGVILNNEYWREMTLLKSSTGEYLAGFPGGDDWRNIWGVPIVPTPALARGQFLVGVFGLAAQIVDRETCTVEISTEDSDNFRRNLVTIRAEERLALIVTRPEAIVFGAFPVVT